MCTISTCFRNFLRNKINLCIALLLGLFVLLMLSSCNGASQTSNNNQKDLPQSKEGNSINVQFDGEHCTSDVSSSAKKNEDLQMHLNIEYFRDPNTNWKHNPDPDGANLYPEGELTVPIVEYELNYENIHVYIGGKEYIDSYTFEYQNNERNTLTIKKDYTVNDIKIVAKATPRKSTLTLYGIEFKDELAELFEDGGIHVSFKTPYQNQGKKLIRTLSNGAAFPVFEDDDIEVTFSITNSADTELLKDFWFRTNARYCEDGVNFYREFSQDGKTLKFYVPHYVVNDHCEILLKKE